MGRVKRLGEKTELSTTERGSTILLPNQEFTQLASEQQHT